MTHTLYKKTDWIKFRSLCPTHINLPHLDSLEETTTLFCNKIINVANICTPPHPATFRRKIVLWWNQECSLALCNRRKTLHLVKYNPTPENLINFCKMRGKAKWTFKKSRISSWENYVSKISPQTPAKQIWAMIRTLEKKSSFQPLTGLYEANTFNHISRRYGKNSCSTLRPCFQ